MKVESTRDGTVALLRFANAPVNALSVGNGFVDRIADAVRAALDDPACTAIVLAGSGKMFCGGADLNDFYGPATDLDRLRDLLTLIEQADKPIIMANHGLALGGGLELALAGHYRIAHAGARLGFPEITLGLIPGAGGTQRLPRLVGAEPAIALMLSGQLISAEEAARIGLVDEVVDGDVLAAALERAQAGLQVRRSGALTVPDGIAAAVAAHRSADQTGLSHARSALLECVSALPNGLASGLALERELFAKLLESETSRALRHAFLGERIVARVPNLAADVKPREVKRVGVVGGGTMGSGIAIALLNADLPVTLVELRDDVLARTGSTIRKTIGRDVEKQRIEAATAERRIAALTPASTLDALSNVDLVVEAVFEEMDVKRQVFTGFEAVVRPDAILATNTSTLNVDEIAAVTKDPSRVVGLHFFSPANIMRLLEVVRGRETAPDVLATAMQLGKRLGRVRIASGVCDGFIGNRMFEEYLRQAWFMLEEGAMPEQIDGALERWGMAMGPCRTMDLVGQDIGWAIRKRRALEQPERPYSGVIDRICELGRFGQKTGAGIYTYPDGRTAQRDPEIERLIEDYSSEIGIRRRAIGDDEIVSRCLLALINEGARIVGEGIAYRPVDCDMAFLNGYGFPRARGGPMFQADLMGLPRTLELLRERSAGRNGWAWEPAPLIVELADRGSTFAALNR